MILSLLHSICILSIEFGLEMKKLKKGLTEKGYGHFFIPMEEIIERTYKKKIK